MGMPWLQNKHLSFDDLDETNLADDTFVVVPANYAEAAKRMLSRYEVGMQLGREYHFNLNPLYGFSRRYKSNIHVEKDLLNARIPCATVKSCAVRAQDKNWQGYMLTVYYWEEAYSYTLKSEYPLVYDIEPDKVFTTLDSALNKWKWDPIIAYALKLKTLTLLQGNSNGLPKTYEQGQDWSFD